MHERTRNEQDITAPPRTAVFIRRASRRAAFIRTTTVIVDGAWYLVGAAHWRCRGTTFDGSTATASFDRQMQNGYSSGGRAFRPPLMMAKLGVTPLVGGIPSGD